MPKAMGARVVRAAIVLCFSLVTGTATSQSLIVTKQVLDRVEAFNGTTVLEMPFNDPNRTQDFINTGIAGTSIVACKLTAVDGLFCLDGKVVKRWPNTDEPGTFVNEFSCADAALGLDTKKTDCTGMTVALSGDIFIAGRKGSTFSLIKVIAKPNSGCPTGYGAVSGGQYCAREQYAGRPQLVDIDPIDGETAAAFKPCPTCAAQAGVLGLEEKKTVSFFPDPKPTPTTAPVVIASGQAWGLAGNEQLLSASLLQIPDGSGGFQNFALVTTTTGRILAKRTDAAGSVFQVFTIPLERQPSAAQCNFDTQHYELRTRSKTGRVYVTDRNFCQVMALVPNGLPFTTLVNDGDPNDLTLSTASNSETNPPTGATLAPGISIDLKDCSVNCTLVENDEGKAGAAFLAVKLNTGSNSNATAFLVEGLPDCRYRNEPEFPPEMLQKCNSTPGVIVDPDNTNEPAAQLLNVTPLLPSEILKLFDASGVPPAGLPQLLISHQYRGQRRTDFIFRAFFFVTEPGVHFVDNFTAEFDVPVLEGVTESLGCVPDPSDLIAWDIMTNVSELYRSVDVNGDTVGEYVDTLTNVGCRNPTKTQQTRISLLPFNLEVNRDTYGPTIVDPQHKSVTLSNDAVFARLVQNLYDDLEYVRRELACKTADATSGQPPIANATCNTLASRWANGKIKLDKCIAAAFQPKQSTADENCNSFASQLANYRAGIPATTPTRDVANRVGELKMRVDVISHVFTTRMLPSMTTAGFCREFNSPSCPDPWQ